MDHEENLEENMLRILQGKPQTFLSRGFSFHTVVSMLMCLMLLSSSLCASFYRYDISV